MRKHPYFMSIKSNSFDRLKAIYDLVKDDPNFKVTTIGQDLMDQLIPPQQEQVKARPRPNGPVSGSRYTDDHLDKGIKAGDLIVEIINCHGGKISKKELNKEFNKWPLPGRTGYEFAPSTFSAQFSTMRREGTIIDDQGMITLNKQGKEQ